MHVCVCGCAASGCLYASQIGGEALAGSADDPGVDRELHPFYHDCELARRVLHAGLRHPLRTDTRIHSHTRHDPVAFVAHSLDCVLLKSCYSYLVTRDRLCFTVHSRPENRVLFPIGAIWVKLNCVLTGR